MTTSRSDGAADFVFPPGLGKLIGAYIYEPCTHRWWHKLPDWLARHEHSAEHIIAYLPAPSTVKEGLGDDIA